MQALISDFFRIERNFSKNDTPSAVRNEKASRMTAKEVYTLSGRCDLPLFFPYYIVIVLYRPRSYPRLPSKY